MSDPSVADLLAIAPRPELLTIRAIARALRCRWARAAELKRLALRQAAPPHVATLMHTLGINREEAETYIHLQRTRALNRSGNPHG